ncbi:PREDICTED: GDNF family receptor alpha-4 [Galeopterus variegatus]|uniref:GDNF family receptor alpha-4 n=1 Tax=Galeopterus variegatus TaxID=482537 RepID=A0ABM0RY10_GALVR|nr:PREDICTED: GDNF family receptor alpha-4 [Galeopterus variegatus]
MARCLGPVLLLLLLLGSESSAGGNRCVDAAEACTADARCQRLRAEYVAQCLGPGGCPRARCRRALRHFFARGPPALTHALLFCPCSGPACAERRRQTFVPDCAFSGRTAVTPNYLDNTSARVAPWCDCRASGNRHEECEAFRGLFTRNRCLDGAIKTFESGWTPILQDQLDLHRNPEQAVTALMALSWTQFSASFISLLPYPHASSSRWWP